MASAAERALRSWLDEQVRAAVFPSWQALVATGGRVLFDAAGGLAVREPDQVAATTETLYDLASLTKPLVTAALALELAEDGVLPLDLPVGRLLDEMSGPPRDRVTVLDLMTHRAGFAAWRPLYLETRPPLRRYAAAAALSPLAYPPQARVIYSDLGYLVLGACLEQVAGASLGELWRKRLLPLAADALRFPPAADDGERCAATERGNAYERAMAGAEEGDPRFRTELIRGAVHDGHAHALGGIAPHAGLFGTAAGVARLAREYTERGSVLGPAARALAHADLTATLDDHRSAAFELARADGTGASGVLPETAVGHSGFTGTSLWLEPARDRVYVLLTNRVHPVVAPRNMNAVRREFHRRARQLAEAAE